MIENNKNNLIPRFIKPMKAKLVSEYFSNKDWIFERKLDGERCLTVIKNGNITLYSRNRKKINISYPEIINSIYHTALKNAVLDGEIVAFEGKKTSFSKLQERINVNSKKEIKKSKIKPYYYIFDIINLDNEDLRNLPLVERKKLLKKNIDFKNNLKYLNHKNQYGKKYYNIACNKGWEGLIAKHKNSEYKSGRSSKWLKFKCVKESEYVIGGYTEPEGQRIGFGSLLIGYYHKNKFIYAGKVGTGFNDQTLYQLKKMIKNKRIKESPFEDYKDKNNNFVKPELVAQIKYTEKTKAGKLRHPVYLGLRRDKKAKDVKY